MRARAVVGGVVAAVAVGAVAVAGVVVVTQQARDDGFPPATGGLPYSAPDVVNPMRGQFDNILTGLFPQANDAQDALPDWPGTRDAAIRLQWRSLQPVDPSTLPDDASDDERYDFSRLDQALDAYEAQGRRVSLRISSYDSCCQQREAGEVNIGIPDWLAAVPGAVDTYDRGGVTEVVPDWNSDVYLDNIAELLGALGRRYDGDERLSVFEMSGYGDFSENVLPVLRDELDTPGPSPEDSERELGYFSQYRDQFITADSITRLVTANLRAFPRTQMVTAPGNAQIVKELMRDNPAVADVLHPVGIRSDCLGVFGVLPTWAVDRFSRYVETEDPIIEVLRNRLTQAPVMTEWCQLPGGDDPADYYARALRSVIDEHVSMTASSGFPDQLAGTPMDPELYDLWRRANVYAGYRYVAEADLAPADDGVGGAVRWTNFGVSSTHERWTIGYQLRDASGTVVAEAGSALDLRDIDVEQDTSSDTPTATTREEPLRFDVDLDPGTYTVSVVVAWDEHKPNATTTVDLEPMNLAMGGRTDGAYPIGSFTVAPG